MSWDANRSSTHPVFNLSLSRLTVSIDKERKECVCTLQCALLTFYNKSVGLTFVKPG